MHGETINDIMDEMRDAKSVYDRYRCVGADCDAIDSLSTISAYADRIEEARRRECRWMKDAARWILCHDIYGHMASELLAEAKEILNDDGWFASKRGR